MTITNYDDLKYELNGLLSSLQELITDLDFKADQKII
jgi:hypothetical protein